MRRQSSSWKPSTLAWRSFLPDSPISRRTMHRGALHLSLQLVAICVPMGVHAVGSDDYGRAEANTESCSRELVNPRARTPPRMRFLTVGDRIALRSCSCDRNERIANVLNTHATHTYQSYLCKIDLSQPLACETSNMYHAHNKFLDHYCACAHASSSTYEDFCSIVWAMSTVKRVL